LREIIEAFDEVNKENEKNEKKFIETSKEVVVEINLSITALQFQDRLTQILGNLSNNIDTVTNSLHQFNENYIVGDVDKAVNALNWNEQFMQAYTTAEEKQIHINGNVIDESDGDSADGGDVVFL